MGRVVGLSWIFCVKRVYVFCLRDLHHLAKALRTLQKIRSNPDQAMLGRVLIPHTNKKRTHKGCLFYYGASSGIVLDLLHAHRVLFSVLRTCQQNLFAIRHKCRAQIRSNSTKCLRILVGSHPHTLK